MSSSRASAYNVDITFGTNNGTDSKTPSVAGSRKGASSSIEEMEQGYNSQTSIMTHEEERLVLRGLPLKSFALSVTFFVLVFLLIGECSSRWVRTSRTWYGLFAQCNYTSKNQSCIDRSPNKGWLLASTLLVNAGLLCTLVACCTLAWGMTLRNIKKKADCYLLSTVMYGGAALLLTACLLVFGLSSVAALDASGQPAVGVGYGFTLVSISMLILLVVLVIIAVDRHSDELVIPRKKQSLSDDKRPLRQVKLSQAEVTHF